MTRYTCVPVLALLALLGMALLPPVASAQSSDILFRLYWSSWMNGRMVHSPADSGGTYTSAEPLAENIKAELEMIFMRRLGLSYSRHKLERAFSDSAGIVPGCGAPPCEIEERGLQESVNLTAYAWPVTHGAFNAFAGGGAGNLDYDLRVAGVQDPSGELFNNLSQARWFWGIEYTFERIGFRIEVSKVTAHKELLGASAEIEQRLTYLSMVIPLN